MNDTDEDGETMEPLLQSAPRHTSHGGKRKEAGSKSAGTFSHTLSPDDVDSLPPTLDRDGVLAALGYHPAKVQHTPAVTLLDPSDLCRRCGKKVYPVERVDVGILYHRGCFKCKTCGTQLTIRTFHREVDPDSNKTKDVYCKNDVPKHTAGPLDPDSVEIRRAINAQKHASSQVRGTGYEHESHYVPDSIEFEHVREVKRRRKVVRRSSTLRSYKDFEKYGVFDAQTALEKCHREEEDELYQQMFDEREKHVERVVGLIGQERERTVKSLILLFEKKEMPEAERKSGLKKIDQYFARQTEERKQLVIQRLGMEEQAAVARMIERHCQEMLVLIAEKEKQADERMKKELMEHRLLGDAEQRYAPPSGDSDEDDDYEAENENEEEDEEEEDEEQEKEETEDGSEGEYFPHENRDHVLSRDPLASHAVGFTGLPYDRRKNTSPPMRSAHAQQREFTTASGTGHPETQPIPELLESPSSRRKFPGSASSAYSQREDRDQRYVDWEQERISSGSPYARRRLVRTESPSGRESPNATSYDSPSRTRQDSAKQSERGDIGGGLPGSENPGPARARPAQARPIQSDSTPRQNGNSQADMSPSARRKQIYEVNQTQIIITPRSKKKTTEFSSQTPGTGAGKHSSDSRKPSDLNIHITGTPKRSPNQSMESETQTETPARKHIHRLESDNDRRDTPTRAQRKLYEADQEVRKTPQKTPTQPQEVREEATETPKNPSNFTPTRTSTMKDEQGPRPWLAIQSPGEFDGDSFSHIEQEQYQFSDDGTSSCSDETSTTSAEYSVHNESQLWANYREERENPIPKPVKKERSKKRKRYFTTPDKTTPSAAARSDNATPKTKQMNKFFTTPKSGAKTPSGRAPGGADGGRQITAIQVVGKDKSMQPAARTPTKKRSVVKLRVSTRVQKGSEGNDKDSGNEDDFEDIPARTPDVVPPPCKKEKLYATPEVFKFFDDQAVAESKKNHNTFTDLVRQLSKRCETELQKVRAIYRWITAKDLNALDFTGTLDPDSPLSLLRGIQLGTESYHNLFKRLCSYAGLPCEIIDGRSKGVGYKPGQKFKSNMFRNQWTAVCVDGAWRFVNCNWGARHVKGPRDEILTYKCDEFYFLTDPEDHIYQHYPDDAHWQLLRKPLSLEDFVRLPIVKSPFFNSKLQFHIDYSSVLDAPDGSAEVRIICPKMMGFACKLKSKEGQVKSEVLLNRVLIRVIGNMVVLMVNLPSPGAYYLDVFVASNWRSDSMDNACAFQIACSGVSTEAHVTYPQLGVFGRTPRFHKYGVVEDSHHDPYVETTRPLEIKYGLSRDLKLGHGMKLWNHRDKQLLDYDRYAMIKQRTESGVTFTLKFPRRGCYVFSLFATELERTSAELECISRYFIDCRYQSENATPFPKASKRWRHCVLNEPISGDLSVKSKVRFQIESSFAKEMVVAVNDAWFTLKNAGPLWQTVIFTSEKPGKAILYGRFQSSKQKYIPLLEYNIKGDSTAEDEMRMMYKYL